MNRRHRPATRRGKARPAAKRHAVKTRRHNRDTGHWPWLLSGLAIGLVVSATVWWWLNGGRDRPAAQAVVTTKKAAPDTGRRQPTQTASTGQTGAPPPEGPRFDFYRLLPKMEVVIPEEELNRERASLPKRHDKGPFIIQAGSFRRHEEADNLKARLALMGIESDIQSIVVGNGQTWHRVRIGPFRDTRTLRKIRRRLRRARIEFVVIELSG